MPYGDHQRLAQPYRWAETGCFELLRGERRTATEFANPDGADGKLPPGHGGNRITQEPSKKADRVRNPNPSHRSPSDRLRDDVHELPLERSGLST